MTKSPNKKDLSVCVSTVLNDYTESVLTGLVANIGYSLNLFLLVAVYHLLDKSYLIYLIGYLGDHYSSVFFLDCCTGAYLYLTASGLVRLSYST